MNGVAAVPASFKCFRPPGHMQQAQPAILLKNGGAFAAALRAWRLSATMPMRSSAIPLR